MTPQDIKTIQTHPFNPSSPVKIILSKGDGEIGELLSRFCDDLIQLVPHASVKNDSDIGFKGPVAVVGRHRNIAYATIPTRKILPLFLDALDPVQQDVEIMPENDFGDKVKLINLPAVFKLYMSDQCPHCPQTIRNIQDIANRTPLVRLTIVNAGLFPQQAQTAQIRSVPTLILDDQFRWIGQVDIRELMDICINRDPSELSADSLRQLIEDGDAARLSDMMTERDEIFPALIELLVHQRWSVRLGAMVAVEYLAEEAPHLALALCQYLWDRFPQLSAQIQGDVTHLFGLVDSDVTRANLGTIAAGDFEKEVITAAAEVLAEMGT